MVCGWLALLACTAGLHCFVGAASAQQICSDADSDSACSALLCQCAPAGVSNGRSVAGAGEGSSCGPRRRRVRQRPHERR